MANPAESLHDLLVIAGVAVSGAQTGWGVFVGKVPETPDTAIALMLTGGQSPNPRWLLDFPSVQALVRGDKNGYQAAYTKTVQVKDALLGFEAADVNGDRMVAINMQGDIVSLGFDEDNRVMFSINFALIIEPATGTNRLSL